MWVYEKGKINISITYRPSIVVLRDIGQVAFIDVLSLHQIIGRLTSHRIAPSTIIILCKIYKEL